MDISLEESSVDQHSATDLKSYHRTPLKPVGHIQTTPPTAVDRQTPPLTPKIFESDEDEEPWRLKMTTHKDRYCMDNHKFHIEFQRNPLDKHKDRTEDP